MSYVNNTEQCSVEEEMSKANEDTLTMRSATWLVHSILLSCANYEQSMRIKLTWLVKLKTQNRIIRAKLQQIEFSN